MRSRRPHSPELISRRHALLAGASSIALAAAIPRALAGGPHAVKPVPPPDPIPAPAALRGSTNYESWRQSMIWQRRKPPRYPDVIVQARSAAEVAAAVRFAARRGWRVATRCGGHSTSACFLRERGMLIDVSQLQDIRIDPVRRVAHAGPGVLARAFCAQLAEHDLTFPTTHCGMVPLGGFLLGGGLGLNGNAWGGFSTFNIRSARIVTADGELRTASPTENADLYWALRGGGPGLFGVVTEFELDVYPLPKAIVGTTLSFRFSEIVDVVRALAEIGPRTDRDVEILGYVGLAEDALLPHLRPEDQGLAVHLHANAYLARKRDAAAKARPLLSHAISTRAIARHTGEEYTLEDLFMLEELSFSQRRWTGDNIFTNRLDDVAGVLQKRMPSCPARDAQAVMLYKGSPSLPDAACSTVGDFYSSFYCLWDDPAQDAAILDYIAGLYTDLEAYSVGSNINEMNQEGRPGAIHRCFTPTAWRRLAELRTQWDPKRVFHDFYGAS